MSMHTILPRVFYGTAAGLTLAGVAFWVVPAAGGPGRAPADTALEGRIPTLPAPSADTTKVTAILEGNLLSEARRPPRTRLRPAGAPEAAPETRPRPAAFQPRLFGTVVGPAEASALIDADPAVPGAEVYRLGDRLLGRRLTDISDSNVVLEGPVGRLVLRLERARGPSR